MSPVLARALGAAALSFALAAAAGAPAVPRGDVRPPFPDVGMRNLTWGATTLEAEANVTGALPAWLTGSLYRNGPGRFLDAGAHWFDGLAIVHAFRFSGDGAVLFSRQFVRSAEYNTSAPGVDPCRTRFRREATTAVPHSKSVNTAVTIRRINGSLLTNTGDASSNQFDPANLDTVAAPFVFDDKMPADGPSPSHGAFGRDGTFYHFVGNFRPPMSYQLYRVPPGTRTRTVFAELKPQGLGVPLFMHSFALTEHYAVLVEQPCAYALDFKWSEFGWYPSLPTQWRVVELATGSEVATLASDAFFFFHVINAYEAANGSVVVDLLPYNDTAILDALYVEQMEKHPERMNTIGRDVVPVRYVLDPAAPNGTRVVGRRLSTANIELPRVSPAVQNREYRYAYGMHLSSEDSPIFDAIARVDVETGESLLWSGGPDTWPGEPIFVPRPASAPRTLAAAPGAEDDGVVLTVVLDSATSESFLAVIDASTMREVARATVSGTVVPFGFHGAYY